MLSSSYYISNIYLLLYLETPTHALQKFMEIVTVINRTVLFSIGYRDQPIYNKLQCNNADIITKQQYMNGKTVTQTAHVL